MSAIVGEYKGHMRGVDLSDMLLALYQISIKSKKWYSPIVHYCFNVAVVVGWLMYKRHMAQLGMNNKSIMALKDFQCEIASALTKAGKMPLKMKHGRISNDTSTPPKRTNASSVQPVADVRYDDIEHWPEYSEVKIDVKIVPMAGP